MRRAGRVGRVEVGLVTLALAAVAIGACSGSEEGDTPRSAGLAVGTRFETFVDTSRPTEGRGDVPAQPSRTFETSVYYPAEGKPGGDPTPNAPAATRRGPFPLILFSHGSGVSSPVRYDLLFRSWAAAGYVIAAPKYPLSSTSLPDAGADVVNQPADVSFLISEMVKRSDDPTTPYSRLIDPNRIAAAGHSLGAMTTLGAVFNACCIDRRIRAGIALAGREAAFPADQWFAGIRTPLLVVHGDDDRLIRIAEAQKLFSDAPPPKVMLTVFGGDHNRPFGGSLTTTENPERLGATESGPTRLVNSTVVAFLDRYLKDRTDALSRLRTELAEEYNVKLDVVER